MTTWLHDVVENTRLTIDQIHTEFDATVAAAIDATMRCSGEHPELYYRRVAGDQIVLRVKRADLAHNDDPTQLTELPINSRTHLQARFRHAAGVLDKAALRLRPSLPPRPSASVSRRQVLPPA